MRFSQTERTLTVEYSSPIRESRRYLRVMPPAERGGQKVLSLDWRCVPAPDSSEESQDDFGNRVLSLYHRFLEGAFRFELRFALSHNESTPVLQGAQLPPTGIGAFLLPSALCNFSGEIETAVKPFRNRASLAPFETAQEICNFLFQTLEYTPHSTTIHTSAAQILESRRGVCQDFAHLMIAICRRLKLPARYVSGYLSGSGAPHAWCEVLLGDQWHGFDPTHGRVVCSRKYLFVACGRDFYDCTPHSGTYYGKARARLSGNVTSRELFPRRLSEVFLEESRGCATEEQL